MSVEGKIDELKAVIEKETNPLLRKIRDLLKVLVEQRQSAATIPIRPNSLTPSGDPELDALKARSTSDLINILLKKGILLPWRPVHLHHRYLAFLSGLPGNKEWRNSFETLRDNGFPNAIQTIGDLAEAYKRDLLGISSRRVSGPDIGNRTIGDIRHWLTELTLLEDIPGPPE